MAYDGPNIEALRAAVGQNDSPDGRTSVQVDRQGQFWVEHRQVVEYLAQGDQGPDQRGEKEPEVERVEGSVTDVIDVDLNELLARAAELPWEQLFPNRLGLPDEPVIEFHVEDAAGQERSVQAWLRDIEKDPSLAQLLDPLRSLVERSTDGRRYL